MLVMMMQRHAISGVVRFAIALCLAVPGAAWASSCCVHRLEPTTHLAAASCCPSACPTMHRATCASEVEANETAIVSSHGVPGVKRVLDALAHSARPEASAPAVRLAAGPLHSPPGTAFLSVSLPLRL